MTAEFDVFGDTDDELKRQAEATASVFFGGKIDRRRIHINAEAIQTVSGEVVGWIGHATVSA